MEMWWGYEVTHRLLLGAARSGMKFWTPTASIKVVYHGLLFHNSTVSWFKAIAIYRTLLGLQNIHISSLQTVIFVIGYFCRLSLMFPVSRLFDVRFRQGKEWQGLAFASLGLGARSLACPAIGILYKHLGPFHSLAAAIVLPQNFSADIMHS